MPRHPNNRYYPGMGERRKPMMPGMSEEEEIHILAQSMNVEDLKNVARRMAKQAVKEGRIQAGRCIVCNGGPQCEMHHLDYLKPLDVIWLCKQHHEDEHTRQDRVELHEKKAATSTREDFKRMKEDWENGVYKRPSAKEIPQEPVYVDDPTLDWRENLLRKCQFLAEQKYRQRRESYIRHP